MKPTRRLLWFVLSTVVLCALLGGVYGRRVEATTDGDEPDVHTSYDAFSKVFDVVEKNYADPLDPDKALFGPLPNSPVGAIPGMLRTLDPHSNFFDPKALAQMREDQRGHYYGVGMRIEGKPNVWFEPFPAGVRIQSVDREHLRTYLHERLPIRAEE